MTGSPAELLERFSPAVREWFLTTFGQATDAQAKGWPAIAEGDHTLLLAPTGSGKTLAAFLWAIDALAHDPVPEKQERTRVLYLSPIKALAVDVEKNLRAPIAGIRAAAERRGESLHTPTVGIRTGDTPAKERAAMRRHPPDILITTPESLYLMLTSGARENLRDVRWVIVDEIHAVAGTKRGAHLALSLERLDAISRTPPQRIGLSATQRPLEEIARFLGGRTADGPRPVTVVDAGMRKALDLEVIVPIEDMGSLGARIDDSETGPLDGEARSSIWPHVHPRILELIRAHRTTLIFCNARRLAERLAAKLNELADEELVKAHHGSLAREQRLLVEDELKTGRLKALVATSSLELGIDMGTVDLVIQVESPGAVSRGLQRIGRAGHQVGEPSTGKIFPKYRGDLLEVAVVVDRMREGAIESTRIVRNPLDVLAQQIVAMCAVDEWQVDELRELVRGAANFAELGDDSFEAVLDLLAGRYPSDEFAGLRPRVVWDRVRGTVRARDGAGRIAITNGGTIPDRGLFGVFLPEGARVGELDEEMVYESRPGDTFVLGASTWRIDQITHDRVIVVPAPGEPGRMPFWHGDQPGRPIELGRAIGAFTRDLRARGTDAAVAHLEATSALDPLAARNLVAYLDEQVEATGALPDDRTIVVERFPDELGDWRVCILTPFGARVHAPWGMAIRSLLTDRLDVDVQVLWSDDGIVLRLPDAIEHFPVEDLAVDPDAIEDLVVDALPGSSLFGARFREAAARALLLPKRRPGERTPLWQQRQRAAGLLEVAAGHPTFPIILEATRECLQDVFDLPALVGVLRDVRARKIRVVTVDSTKASPFAQSLLYSWIATFMYEGDAPLAERRAAALSLDRDLLRELLGTEELRELLDADALTELELDLQRLNPAMRSRVRGEDDVVDLLRDLGDLTEAEVDARSAVPTVALVAELVAAKRVVGITVAGEIRLVAAEDAAMYRDVLGAALPPGLPMALTESRPEPLVELVARYARTHGPFLADDAAARFGLTADRVTEALRILAERDRVVRGEFRPDGTEREWCDTAVLRRLRRRSLAKLRHEVEPVEPEVLARFLPSWHGMDAPRHGVDTLFDALGLVQGCPIAASTLELDVLPARVGGYRPDLLDELLSSGEIVWAGAGAIGPRDGRVVLAFRDRAGLLLPPPLDPPVGPLHEAIVGHLTAAGASFWPELLAATGNASEAEVLAALWDLVWTGHVTNDGFGALRAQLGRGRSARRAGARPRPGSLRRIGPPAGSGRWSLVAALTRDVTPTARVHGLATQLLERHGVVTREATRAEGVVGGYAAVYPVLRALEESGKVRRGYFVAGLGAAQFALPGAVDRLRAHRTDDPAAEPRVLAATDPAQPYGAALPWPEGPGRPSRAAGAYVVLRDGRLVAFLERGARTVVTFADDPSWCDALVTLVKDGRLRQIELTQIDGRPAREHPLAEAWRAVGARDTPRGLVVRG
ncbi:MAG: DEAD/DEAH box helicase [Acidimicrobiia bacterium]